MTGMAATDLPLTAEDLPGIRGALTRYRVMAWIVGVLLLVLTCIAMPMKYLGDDDRLVGWVGVLHGWLYAILLITAYDLGRRARWSWLMMLKIALAGTVPFVTFIAEHYATKDAKRRIDAVGQDAKAG